MARRNPMLERLHFETREDWLRGRQNGLGASEAAAVAGISPWMSNIGLWRIKTGQQAPKDLSGNEAVAFGNNAEGALRALFAAMHPEYVVRHHPFDILRQSERPWLTATLDGELTEIAGRRQGVLEVKTTTCGKRTDWEKWLNQVPQYYYTQCLWQMLATRWDFVVLFALLLNLEGDGELRAYKFEREDCAADMTWLLDKGERFWGYVERNQMPPMVLPML